MPGTTIGLDLENNIEDVQKKPVTVPYTKKYFLSRKI